MDGDKIEKLILLVNDYSELYDMSNKNYSNQNRREIIWSHIGEKINESGEVCKHRWKTLRDGFQRAVKNNKTKSGQAAKGSKKWKYWDAMAFLLPHIKGRETHTNVTQEENEYEDGEGEAETQTETQTEYESNDFQSELEDMHNDDNDENLTLTSPISSISQPNIPLSCSSSGANTSRPVSRTANIQSVSLSKKNKVVNKKPESLPEILKEYVNDRKRSRLEKQMLTGAIKHIDDKNSSLFEFFANMAKTTATFPPILQARVKSKVFEIVNSYELQLLTSSSDSLTQNQPSMETQPPMLNQPRTLSSSSFYNQPSHGASGYYSVFGSQISSNESSCNQNIVQLTRNDQHAAVRRDSLVQQEEEFSYGSS